ncbi:hypothetical protein [Arsenophonus endosymbiont of Crataerina pallida]|uniref:hypothetical protein n=2 Tax=unclassified Arsenophonus TaxID=2627083 RepID=UPI003BB0B474
MYYQMINVGVPAHKCQVCGYKASADINSAHNILATGLAVLTCRGMVQLDRPLKQEPTKMIQTSV